MQFFDYVIYRRFQMAVNFVPLNTETSNFQEMFSYFYTAVHIEKNT